MYNLIEYSDIYLKITGSLWQYYKDELSLDVTRRYIDFLADNDNSISFKFKEKNNSGNRKQWHKRCWNNGTIKLANEYLENPWNSIN